MSAENVDVFLRRTGYCALILARDARKRVYCMKLAGHEGKAHRGDGDLDDIEWQYELTPEELAVPVERGGRLEHPHATQNAGPCVVCNQTARWIDCPTGGWWAHDTHPDDNHDAFVDLRVRPGDQVLPDGDESLTDDQEILIREVKERRDLGIRRYGQGHRPFNGRDTLKDMFDEQLDFMVYLTSVVRMAQASREELIEVVAKEFGSSESALDIATRAVDRIMGWVSGQIIKEGR